MNPKFSAGLIFTLAFLFGIGSLYTFFAYKELGSSLLMLLFSIYTVVLGLKYFKKINSIKFLDPLLIKDINDQPITSVNSKQFGIKNINTLTLTPEQQKFVNHYSYGAHFLGMWYYTFSGLTEEGLKQLFPIYGDIQQLKLLTGAEK